MWRRGQILYQGCAPGGGNSGEKCGGGKDKAVRPKVRAGGGGGVSWRVGGVGNGKGKQRGVRDQKSEKKKKLQKKQEMHKRLVGDSRRKQKGGCERILK